MAKQKYWTRARAKRELATWRTSGLSLAEYARQQGLTANRLYRWKRRLEPSRDMERALAVAAPAFLPVRVVSPVVVSSAPFEIVLDDPVRVRVPADFDATALRRLLETVTGC